MAAFILLNTETAAKRLWVVTAVCSLQGMIKQLRGGLSGRSSDLARCITLRCHCCVSAHELHVPRFPQLAYAILGQLGLYCHSSMFFAAYHAIYSHLANCVTGYSTLCSAWWVRSGRVFLKQPEKKVNHRDASQTPAPRESCHLAPTLGHADSCWGQETEG